MKNSLLSVLKSGLSTALIIVTAACASGTSSGPVPEGYYRVQSGDTLYRIGQRFGQSVNTLSAWNNLRNPSQIEVGQVLRVRAKVGAGAARTLEPVNRLRLQWPVDGGSSNILSHYNGSTNKGIDIGGSLGTPVKAAADGKVLYAGEGVRGYGKLILITHNSNTLTAYAHNDSLNVQKDQTVRAGQIIARMGSSDSDRVKLHFEVRIKGKAVDPMPYLNR
ncbi:peptidoglycan DD-metalloendopeptidase family protein [Neisseria sp. S1]|uniref:peptidoglycan DD-metalloendopeptidase family protein n=1 Tax=Neisseria sp. S1 TaxID=3318354 RepID=UPI003A858ED6